MSEPMSAHTPGPWVTNGTASDPQFMYAGESDETFWAKTPEEYLFDKFDGGVLDEALSKYIDGVEVVQYRRRTVEQQWVADQANLLMDDFNEAFADEFGGEDDDCFKAGAVEDALREELFKVLARHVEQNLRPWQCEVVSRRTFTRDEVQAILLTRARLPAQVEAAANQAVTVIHFTKGGVKP